MNYLITGILCFIIGYLASYAAAKHKVTELGIIRFSLDQHYKCIRISEKQYEELEAKPNAK